ncbi:MAG: galactose mutarotase [Clostridia bacterium]|nr:galactose mutarotase [Clostridia bacterium]
MVTVHSEEFGRTKDGRKVTAFDLSNGSGMRVRILDFGCTVQSLTVPDRGGRPVDVVLGYDDVTSYEDGSCYYGAVVGRYANRIGGARFVLDGREYRLENSPGESNHVHGVFNKKIFEAAAGAGELTLRYRSPDGEEGYPGTLELEVCCRLREDNALEIAYQATTDAPTPVNLTNHSYFNLNGQDGSTVLDHRLRLNCSRFTEYAETFAQTGRILSVENTPLDFRKEQRIGARFCDGYPQFRLCTGYDHNMILDGKEGELKEIGAVRSEKTGICLEAFTTEPAVHFYSGNYMHFDSVPNGKNGVKYPKNGGFCLEAQHYPDSLNHPHFPSTVLRPGQVYRQKTVYRFSVR